MKHILFVCTHNAGRSQTAKGFWDRYAPDDVRANIRPRPGPPA